MIDPRTLAWAAALGSVWVVAASATGPGSAGSLPDPAWLAQVQAGLAEREYRVSESRLGLQAPNRAHDLRSYFDPTGIRVHDRTAAGSPELMTLRWTGLGRGETLAPVPEGVVTSREARVEIARGEGLEWYENGPEGLEHGFTLEARPAGEGALVLELAAEGAAAWLSGDAVRFRSESGRTLRYGQIAAFDAEGTPVAARFEVPAPDRVHLVVADAGAAYPLTIDPLLTGAPDTQLEAGQAGASLGWSVSSAGDLNGDGFGDVIVGAVGIDATAVDDGAYVVFLGNGGGRLVLPRQLRDDGSGLPVPPWGASGLADGFRLDLEASHPGGTGRVRGEFEACPPGVPFGDASCATALTPAWTQVDGAAPDVTLSHTFTGLTPDTLYRWRSRVLHAPSSVTEPGITPPANPDHGPWRRHVAQAVEADVRALPEPDQLLMWIAGLLFLSILGRRRAA